MLKKSLQNTKESFLTEWMRCKTMLKEKNGKNYVTKILFINSYSFILHIKHKTSLLFLKCTGKYSTQLRFFYCDCKNWTYVIWVFVQLCFTLISESEDMIVKVFHYVCLFHLSTSQVATWWLLIHKGCILAQKQPLCYKAEPCKCDFPSDLHHMGLVLAFTADGQLNQSLFIYSFIHVSYLIASCAHTLSIIFLWSILI